MSEDKHLRESGGMNAFVADSEAPKFYVDPDEEYAAELADGAFVQHESHGHAQGRTQAGAKPGRMWALVALGLAIAAWFIWPAVLAPAGMVAGVVTYIRWRRAAGAWAIAVGLIAFVLYLASL